MPNSLRELFDNIRSEADTQELSSHQACYAIGWIFFDIFERADHDEKNNGVRVSSSDLDRYAKDLPPTKIQRDVFESQQEFGRAAADFMEPEIQNRIEIAIESSIVSTVKSYTVGWKTFVANVMAGLISGILFAAITFAGYYYVKVDPSINATIKAEVHSP